MGSPYRLSRFIPQRGTPHRLSTRSLSFLLLFTLFSSPINADQNSLDTVAPEYEGDDAQLPISNHSPVLQVSASEGYLAETAEMGTTVRVAPSMHSDSLQILVHDEDLKPGMPPATYQYILTGLGATIFAVDQRGYVYLNVPEIDADPPNPSTYQLNIQAREVGTHPIRSSSPVTLTIHIMDVNDNSPVFEQPIYTANVTANGAERALIKILATDIDAGKFGDVTYKITQVTNNADSNFRYDSETNMLMADGQLIPGERYQVVIEAKDGGGRASQAIVIVLATDENTVYTSAPLPGMETFTMPPSYAITTAQKIPNYQSAHNNDEETIQTFVTEVTENTPPNTVVVSLGDDTSNRLVYYNIVGGNEEGKFRIDPSSGTISTLEEFDRERTAMYSLQIETRGRAPDQHLYWTLVQISVLDVNDNSPHFVGPQPFRLRLSIDELDELNPNILIGKISVEDPDENDNGRLALSIQPPMDRLFKISNDGLISVNGDFTAEHFGEHKLFIVARDHGDPVKEAKAEAAVSIFGTLITVATQTSHTTNEVEEYEVDGGMTGASVKSGGVTVPFSRQTTENPAQTEEYEEDGEEIEQNGVHSTQTTGVSSKKTGVTITTIGSSTEYSMETVNGETLANTPSTSQTTQSQTLHTWKTLGPSTWITKKPNDGHTAPTRASTTRQPYSQNASFNSFPPVRPLPSPSTKPPSRLAPVFDPPAITVTVDENEGQTEIAKVSAHYIDGRAGSITYVMQKGDSSLFSVSSFSGSVQLLRALDAETDAQYIIQIGTVESSSLAIDPTLPHTVSITINVADVNDWIPNFESSHYEFAVQEDTLPGTIVGQVHAFDQDRDEPNNRLRYRLHSAGGLEQYFSVNEHNGLVTLARPVDAFADEKITLKIEASDEGEPAQTSMTNVVVSVESTQSSVIPDTHTFLNKPKDGQIQFSLRNYTSSVSESVRPPYLVQVLSVTNKPEDTRFIICNIASGNYRGAFGVTAGNDGNCELRTQMELDRETVERYLLNVTVTAGSQMDFALVSVTVLDTNDNVPRFQYDNDLGISTYFAGVASDAGAFTRVLTVKAEDSDLGNSSVVQYSLDTLAVHHKYFNVSQYGEITTRQSMPAILQKQRINFFEIRVSACDSPISGQKLCSKADVVINVISDNHRFKMITHGLNPQQLKSHEKDILRALRQFAGACTLISVEKMAEHTNSADHQPRTDIYFYAVNPTSRKICKKHEFRRLFDPTSVSMVAGKVQPWFRLEKIVEDTPNEGRNHGGPLEASWKAAGYVLVGLAALIILGAALAICCVCVHNNKFKVSQRAMHSYPTPYAPHAKMPMGTMGTIYLPNPPPPNSNVDKIYETQMLELPMTDEEMTIKSVSRNNTSAHHDQRSIRQMPYRNYGNPAPSAYEGDFSIEENMYAIQSNVPGRLDPVTKRIQTLVIPTPDYDRASDRNKSIL
ncbi:unnamed protein product, partial [Mesorhabditis belari]|uniref:Cadherin domain-containing protein n=1 Tax=Mesorhabditis belari TaxID=2138241 RepID=A0AAF3FF57_9BILA